MELAKSTYKFKIGEQVLYDRGPVALELGFCQTVIATVCARYNNDGFEIYRVEWLPNGGGTVPARGLDKFKQV